MSVTNKCQHCGKSLLSPNQHRLRKYFGEGWDKKTIHYRCWKEKVYQDNLELITEAMARLTLKDIAQCGPAASTTSFSWLLLLLPLRFSFVAFIFARAALTAAAADWAAAASSFFFMIACMCSRVHGYGPVGGFAPLVWNSHAL